MKKNRYIPFGYTMRNGKLVIEQNEANVIRNIYEDYVNGATLKEIADRLTHAGVPYSEKRSDWGKARVARIIENTKYLGDSEYDKIVDDDLFNEAVSAKKTRQTSIPGDLNTEISTVKNHVRCLECGYPMSRRFSKKYKTKVIWTCLNPECGKKVGICDADLLEGIMRLMSRILKNDRLLDPVKNDGKNDETKSRLQEDLDSEISEGITDEEKVARLIDAIAAESYSRLDSASAHATEELKRKIRRVEIKGGFDPGLFGELVLSVRLGEGDIQIITKNNIKIGGKDGSKEDTEKDGYGYPAEE